jgi:hypothetical protein
MYVGDGTWDATRNDFLLPNLVGLNFETMRYNGLLSSSLPPFPSLPIRKTDTIERTEADVLAQ